ncbi:MAG: hypothetical protein ACYSVY_11925 [Planctomycetota bacterium]
MGYWRFDEADGQYAYDSSPYANHGVLGNNDDTGGDAADPQWLISSADLDDPPYDPPYWTTPELVSEVSSGEDWNVAISADQLEMYIGSERDGFAESEVYRAARTSIHEPFSIAVPVWEISIPGYRNHDNVADLSSDGLRIYFNRHYWIDPADFYVAWRTSPTDPWLTPVLIPSLNTAADEYDLAVSADDLAAVFTSSRSGGNRYWVASRNSLAVPWANFALIDALDGFSPRGCDLSADGLTLYVTADGPGSLGSYDVWRLTRSSITSPFGDPIHLVELSSTEEEWDVSLSGDDRTMYLVSRRDTLRLNSGSVFMSRWVFPGEAVPGDLDCDGDLDLDDHAAFAA